MKQEQFKWSKFRDMKNELIADYKELQTVKNVASKHNVKYETMRKWFEFHGITEKYKYMGCIE